VENVLYLLVEKDNTTILERFMKTVTFTVIVSIPDDIDGHPLLLQDMLNTFEDLCAQKSWDLVDAEFDEEDI
jgi:hypothetical protein